ncbi:MAG: response regulator [Candidatus Auribacter fodinae]|jgi:DNA-binding response OmpR family regulator|uniref:Response regulator n=1 Tax=Candidatus Auribacter fodinae TaxID=2093366 RepID=A0A3A4QZR2_9BACT|nr:MAG: response regulator [Candidatus Auribacter fodinae]
MADEKKKILVVDDERDIVNLITDFLEGLDFQVVSASDGEKALQIAIAEKPDLITMDIMMSNKDGYETCLLLKENAATSQIPIIVLTGRNSEQAALAAESFGADYYLSKPFSLEELASVINHLIS